MKDVDEVASFVKECDNWFEYSNGQLMELSTQYREIKMYARERGMDISENASLSDMIGLYDSREEAKQGIYEADAFYLVSADSEVVLRVIKTPSVDERGRTVETAEVTVMDCHGRILEQCDSSQGLREFDQFLQESEKKYGFTECQKYKSASSAREFAKTVADARQEEMKDEKVQKPAKMDGKIARYIEQNHDRRKMYGEKIKRPKKTLSFTQAINLGSVKNEKGMHVIINEEKPAYMAIVRTTDQGLTIQVMDSSGKKETEVNLPPVHVRSSDGFKKIKALQKHYGFSNKMYAFTNIEDAKIYQKSVGGEKEQQTERGENGSRDNEQDRAGKYGRETEDDLKTQKPKKTFSFTQAINLGSVKKETGVHVIVNAENPAYMAVVRTTDQGIAIQIMDESGKKGKRIIIECI